MLSNVCFILLVCFCRFQWHLTYIFSVFPHKIFLPGNTSRKSFPASRIISRNPATRELLQLTSLQWNAGIERVKFSPESKSQFLKNFEVMLAWYYEQNVNPGTITSKAQKHKNPQTQEQKNWTEKCHRHHDLQLVSLPSQTKLKTIPH